MPVSHFEGMRSLCITGGVSHFEGDEIPLYRDSGRQHRAARAVSHFEGMRSLCSRSTNLFMCAPGYVSHFEGDEIPL